MDSYPFSIEPMGVGAILDRAFKTYRNNFVSILLFGALIGGFTTLLSLLLSIFSGSIAAGLSYESLLDMIQSGALGDPQALLSILQGAYIGTNPVLGILSAFVLMPLSMGGIAAIAIGYFRGARKTPKEWFSTVTARAKDILLLNLCLIAAGIVVAIGAFIVIFVLALILGFFIRIPFLGFLFSLIYAAAIFFIVIALATVVEMSYAVLINENVRNFTAIKRAVKLVFSKFWKTIGISILTSLIVAVIGGVLGAVFQIFSFLGGFGLAISSILNTAVDLILAPVSGIVVALLYLSIRIEREGYDLELRAGSFGGYAEPNAEYGRPEAGYSRPDAGYGRPEQPNNDGRGARDDTDPWER
ncbi:hypothetical protein LJC34_06495 [Oscillospiraceae bacterium OttesenSCG-928-G22]|nr:hypothetical protein [Oscillospiraceae bacterium OttesenSCG-928-G22]